MEFPACIHRGHVLTGGRRCYCRHERIRAVVALEICTLCEIAETEGEPAAAITAPPESPPTLDDLPCVHRSDEPLRAEECRSCSNFFGLTEIAVYGCSLHSECTLPQSEVMRSDQPNRLAKWCTTCKDRTIEPGAQPSESSPPPPSSPA